MHLEFGRSIKINTRVDLSTERFVRAYFSPESMARILFAAEASLSSNPPQVERLGSDRLQMKTANWVADVQIQGQHQDKTELLILIDVFNECMDPNTIVQNIIESTEQMGC